MDSPFDVLDIDSDADEREIERAYRRRVLETHPDQGGSVEEFQLVRAAYDAVTSGEQADEWTAESEDIRERSEPSDYRVEYLNYEVLDDHGWTLRDEDLFEKAAAAGLDADDYGRFLAKPHETLLQAAENRGFTWPYACRGGACANCAVAVLEGELSMPVDHILPEEMVDRDIRLSCGGVPVSDMKVVYNLKHMPELEELRLPPHRFERAHFND